MRKTIFCDYCGAELRRYPSQVKKHNFCCRTCLAAYSSKEKNPLGYAKLKDYSAMRRNMVRINKALNPVRMTLETRMKLRNAHLRVGARGYAKFFGYAEHRLVAAGKLGRPLRTGEVVHHVDGNPRNNHPDNLRVFPSQAEHAAEHKRVAGGDE